VLARALGVAALTQQESLPSRNGDRVLLSFSAGKDALSAAWTCKD
jgi:hypothetical protein